MSETQKNFENENTSVAPQEESTVFSNPIEHKDKAAEVKKKSPLKVIIASVTAVAIIAGGAFAISKFIAPLVEDTSSAVESGKIEIIDIADEDLKSCTITNSYGTYKFYPKTETEDDEEVVNWYLENYNAEQMEKSKIRSVVRTVATLVGTKEMTEMSAEYCGFETPKVTAVLEKNNGETVTILIGAENYEKTGEFVTIKGSDKIYLVGYDIKTTVDVEPLSFAKTDITPTFPTTSISTDYKSDEGVLAAFDKLTISGKNYANTVVMERNHNDSINAIVPYNITAPIKHYAQNHNSIVTLFAMGVTPEGAYSYDISAAALKKFDLERPDMHFVIEADGKKMTYRISRQDDGYYAVLGDGMTMIAKVSGENLEFKDFATTDYYYNWISVLYIDDVKQMTVKSPQKTYDFFIKPDTADEEDFVITYNGTLLDSDNFKNYYGACISLSAADYNITKVNGNPEYSLTYVFNDDVGGRQHIEFFKISETKYQYRVDGYDVGTVTSADLKKLVNNTERVATGLQINNN